MCDGPREHQSAGQGLGAHHQSDRGEDRPARRHLVQHEQRREERQPDQRVPERVSVPALPGHGAQAVPAAARPQRSVDRRHRLLQPHTHDRELPADASAHQPAQLLQQPRRAAHRVLRALRQTV